MTPQESREIFLDTIMSEKDINRLQQQGLYDLYITGKVSVETVYKQLKDQGI